MRKMGKYSRRSKPVINHKAFAILLCLTLVLGLAIGGTVAYLTTNTEAVENTFTPAHVSCSVTENFDGTVKSYVNVTNTSDIDAYVRVKLVSYRVNDAKEHIGGTAVVPTFDPGTAWVQKGEYYYYTKPVAPNDKPAHDLISSITLAGSYDDADGGKQVVEVMAEAIQAKPFASYNEAWAKTRN